MFYWKLLFVSRQTLVVGYMTETYFLSNVKLWNSRLCLAVCLSLFIETVNKQYD